MKTFNFLSKKSTIYSLFGLLAVGLVSCGSYQNKSYYDNDGIYGSTPRPQYKERAYSQNENNQQQGDSRYKAYFSSLNDDKTKQEIFTDVNKYSTYNDTLKKQNQTYTSQNQQTSTGYAGWGNNGNGQVTINVYDNNWGYNNYGFNNWYGNNWGWNNYYGNNWGYYGNNWGWNNYYGNSWGWNLGWGYNNWYGNNWCGNGYYGNGYYGNSYNNGYYGNGYAYTHGRRDAWADRAGSSGYSNRSGSNENVVGGRRFENRTGTPLEVANTYPRNYNNSGTREYNNNTTPRTYNNGGTRDYNTTSTPRTYNNTDSSPRQYNNNNTPRSYSQESTPRTYNQESTPRSNSQPTYSQPTRSYSEPSRSYSGGSYGGSSGGGGGGGGRSSGGGGGGRR